MNIKLSIIIPSYNTGNYIAESVLSVFQDVPSAEIIVVDDASNDNTIVNLNRLKLENLSIIQLDKNSPGGAGYPSNIGLQRASGDYIAFVDSDDFFCRGYLSSLLEQIKKTNTDICVDSYKLVDTISHVEKPAYDDVTWRRLTSGHSEGILSKENYFTLSPEPWRKIYSSRLFANKYVKFPVNGWFNEDFPFHWFTGLQAERGISYVNSSLYYHRTKRAGQTTYNLNEAVFFVFQHTREILEFMQSSPLYAGYEGYLLNWLLIGSWKLRFIKDRLDEYYTKYRDLLLSFDKIAVSQFYSFALHPQKFAYRVIKDSASVSVALKKLDGKNIEVK